MCLYSRIRIYATRLYATFVYMQLFPGSQKVLKHSFSYGYMQVSRICNFFFGSRAVAYNRIRLYSESIFKVQITSQGSWLNGRTCACQEQLSFCRSITRRVPKVS